MLPSMRLLPHVALAAAALVFSACGDDDTTSPTQTGSVEILTSTAGESLDPDGYTVAVAGGAGQAIGIDATLTVADVATGSQSVELTGVAGNCTVAGSNPRNVTVTAGATVSTTFDVTCAGMGSVEVTTSTTGDALDPDGYTVSVAGGAGQAIGIDETLTVADVATGTQSVELTGVADNCTVDGDNPRDVTVTADATVATTFDVSCLTFVTNQIAITTDRDGDSEIYLIDADGSNPVNLTNNPAEDLAGAISPDGTRIAFTTDRTGNFEIYVMNVDGTGVTNLTNNPGNDQIAAWSPDGSQLAFTSDRSGDQQIWVMDADGSGATNLTDTPGEDHAFNDWSPDGSQIVFATARDGDAEIYVMDADGSNQTNLTNNPASDVAPAWSPDGSQILFSSDRDGDSEIYVMDADGSNQTNLTGNAASDELPNWSPDGSQIAFTSNRDGDRDVFVMTSAGVGATNVTNDAGDDLAGPPQGWR
jgi:TolB protein